MEDVKSKKNPTFFVHKTVGGGVQRFTVYGQTRCLHNLNRGETFVVISSQCSKQNSRNSSGNSWCLDFQIESNLPTSQTSVADPVHFFGSGSYLDMFLMFSKINNFLWHFDTKSKHLMTPKIKDKKKYFDETVFLTILYNERIIITWGLFVDKGSG